MMETEVPPSDQEQKQPAPGVENQVANDQQVAPPVQQGQIQRYPAQASATGRAPAAPNVAQDGCLSTDRSQRTAILPSIGRLKKEDVVKHISSNAMGAGVEAIIFFTAIACRIVFASVEKAESWVVKGLDFGSHHFDLMMEKDAKPPLWITLRNIPIETGNSDVKRKLGEYGRIVKGPFYNNHPGTKIKNGLRSALIVVQKDIPSFIYVEDTLNKIRRTVSVFHKGQAPKCFRCNGPHLKKDCTKAVYQPGNGKGKAMGNNGGKQTPFNKAMAKPTPIIQTGEQMLPNLDSSDEFPLLVIDDDRETLKRGRDLLDPVQMFLKRFTYNDDVIKVNMTYSIVQVIQYLLHHALVGCRSVAQPKWEAFILVKS